MTPRPTIWLPISRTFHPSLTRMSGKKTKRDVSSVVRNALRRRSPCPEQKPLHSLTHPMLKLDQLKKKEPLLLQKKNYYMTKGVCCTWKKHLWKAYSHNECLQMCCVHLLSRVDAENCSQNQEYFVVLFCSERSIFINHSLKNNRVNF